LAFVFGRYPGVDHDAMPPAGSGIMGHDVHRELD
jgi:hypothetical protein